MPISLPRALSANPGASHLSHSCGPGSCRGRSRCRTGAGPRRSLRSGTGSRRTGPRLRRAAVLVCCGEGLAGSERAVRPLTGVRDPELLLRDKAARETRPRPTAHGAHRAHRGWGGPRWAPGARLFPWGRRELFRGENFFLILCPPPPIAEAARGPECSFPNRECGVSVPTLPPPGCEPGTGQGALAASVSSSGTTGVTGGAGAKA